MKNLAFDFLYKGTAGLITISWDGKEKWESVAIHLFPKKQFWIWGKEEEWYDGPWYSFGLGPLVLICWT